MMPMTFQVSNNVTLLFDFWDVHGPAGMVLSVFVVLLLTVFYEVLKVWRVWLGNGSKLSQPATGYTAPPSCRTDSSSALDSSPSESSLTPIEPQPPTTSTRKSWLLHVIQTLLHIVQVTLGYMLMLCVMSYNTWIFLGVIIGSVLGYFISFPLLGQTLPEEDVPDLGEAPAGGLHQGLQDGADVRLDAGPEELLGFGQDQSCAGRTEDESVCGYLLQRVLTMSTEGSNGWHVCGDSKQTNSAVSMEPLPLSFSNLC
uniref:Copper transport protein n=1 Tax=Amphiprion ocellaris TaxID=80972 RepID=A0AAQ5ZWM5_AMPOC